MAWEAIKTVKYQLKGQVAGGEMVMNMKSTSDGKSCTEMSVMGINTRMVFNGQNGYISVMGQKQDMDEKQINEMKFSGFCPE
jgi:hypothetical protein